MVEKLLQARTKVEYALMREKQREVGGKSTQVHLSAALLGGVIPYPSFAARR